MAVSIKVRFVTSNLSLDVGKIVVNITTDGDASTTHTLNIEDPNGNNLAIAVIPNGQNAEVKVNIPAMSGSYVQGDYIFTPSIDEDGDGNPFVTPATYCFELDTTSQVTGTVVSDCYSLNVLVNDTTTYPTGTTLTRSGVVFHPIIAGEDNLPNTLFSTNTAQISLIRSSGKAYENVTYNVTIGAQVETTDTSISNYDFGQIYEYISFSESHLVRCDNDVCGVISCIDTKIASLIEKATCYGGIRSLPVTDRDTLLLLLSNLSMYNYFVQCQDASKITEYYNALTQLIDATPCTKVGPQEITKQTGVQYITGKSAYQSWLDAGNSGSETDFLNSLFPIGPWTTISDFDSNWQSSSSYPFEYRVIKFGVEFIGGFTLSGTAGSSPYTILTTSFDPGSIKSSGCLPVFSRTTNLHVGTFYKDLEGWKVFGNGNFSPSDDNAVVGIMPLNGVATTSELATADFPDLTSWVSIPANQYGTGHTGTLEWRTDGRFVYFRGTVSTNQTSPAGFVAIIGDYFTGLGISFLNQTRATVHESSNTEAFQAQALGYIQASSTTQALSLYIREFDPADTGTNFVISGFLTRES